MGLERQVVTGAGFRHVLFWKDRGRAGTVLHVYIDGDGTPDIGGYPAADPTSRNPLMLRLLDLDPDRRCCSGAPATTAWPTTPAVAPPYGWMSAIPRPWWRAWPPRCGKYWRRVPTSGSPGSGTAAAAAWPCCWPRGCRRRRPWSRPRPISTSTPGRRHAAPGRSSARSIRRASRRSPRRWFSVTTPAAATRSSRRRVTRKGLGPGVPLTVIPDYDHRCCWEKLWPGLLADLAKQDL
jgi:hypothetical protein